jgi:hypothetical protein
MYSKIDEGRAGGSLMESESANSDEDNYGTLANRDFPDVQVIAKAAHDELRRLIKQRCEISKRIAKIKRTVAGLLNLFGGNELSVGPRELGNSKPIVRPGITQACRKVLMEADCPLTARNVCEQIRQRTTLDLPCSRNLIAAVTTVLGRLAQYGEARTVLCDNGPRAWVWVSSAEDESFHPADSAADSQV